MKLNKNYKNGFMNVTLESIVNVGHDNNIAILKRNNKYFVVVNTVQETSVNECSWAFAYAYDVETLEKANEILKSKI